MAAAAVDTTEYVFRCSYLYWKIVEQSEIAAAAKHWQ